MLVLACPARLPSQSSATTLGILAVCGPEIDTSTMDS